MASNSSVRAFRSATFGVLVALACIAHGQSAATGKPDSVTSFLPQMAGSWNVQAQMWPGPGAQPVALAPAIARRRFVENAFVEEVMEPVETSAQGRFTRVAYLSYNAINQQFEYFSLDTRLPQMMSYAAPGANKVRAGKIELSGSSFVAPEWGARKNVPFMYRLTLERVSGDRQVVQLFLTEQAPQAKEFLAFEYVYSRQRS